MITPFIKWCGSKRRLVDVLMPEVLERLAVGGTYWEPFLGGGAMLLAMPPEIPVCAADACDELVVAWDQVRCNAVALSKALAVHAKNHSKEYYYAVRDWELIEPVQIAARFIYLNKTGFNGLYRKNKSGGFNVPIGRGHASSIPTLAQLLPVHERLQGSRLECVDFEDFLEDRRHRPSEGDVIFADPPYDQTQAYSSGFDATDQRRLAACLRRCARRGVGVVTTNARTPLVLRAYSWAIVERLWERRSISCDAQNRADASCVVAMRP